MNDWTLLNSSISLITSKFHITTNRLIENKLNQHSFIIEIIFIKDDGLGHQKD